MMVTLRVNDWLVLALYTGMNYKISLDVEYHAIIYIKNRKTKPYI